MAPEPPKLRSQLLTWLLIPLFLLLALDLLGSSWIATKFSQRAYDRSLVEIAREISLHLRRADGSLVLDLPDEARKVLLSDPVDRIWFSVAASDGGVLAGEPVPDGPNGS